MSGQIDNSPMSLFMRETRKHKRISKEEEINLAKNYQQTGDITNIHKLVNSNIALVLWLSKKTSTWSNSNLDPSEVISIGCEYLFKAALSWDPNSKAAFAAYAKPFILKGIVKQGARENNLIKLPNNVSEKVRKLKYTERVLLQKHGRQPKVAELAEATGFPEKRIRDLQRAILLSSIVSLDALNTHKDKDDEY